MAGPLDTLQPGQWYEFPASHLREVLPSPVPEGDPRTMIEAWSGGAYDTQRNRLLVWGGGHADYRGNELYAFEVASGQWRRLTNPTDLPLSVHSYDGLEYLPNQDTFFSAPGGSTWQLGYLETNTWLLPLSGTSWTNAGPPPSTVAGFLQPSMTSDYDPLSGRVIVVGANASGTYDAGARSWNLTGEGNRSDLGLNGALDSRRRVFVEVGRNRAYLFPVSNNGAPGQRQALATSGPQAIVNCDAPGFVYDPVSDRFVGWCGGNAIYSLNIDTRVWSQHAATNSVNPGDPNARSRPYWGTFGRFRYMPAYNAFIVVHSIDENVFAYRLTNGSGTSTAANADWSSRASAPGVVRALGFDTQAEWLSHVWDNSYCLPEYAPGCRANAWDQAVKASGAGAVRFDIRSNSGAGTAGQLAVNFSEDYTVQFGANQEFWVQWRQRFDDFVISHEYRETAGSGDWKQIILAQGDRRRADGSVIQGYSCSEFELSVGNVSARDYPNAYIECGGYFSLEDQLPGARFTRQNQRLNSAGTDTACQSYPSGGDTSGCLWFYPNEWMTFMVHLRMGPEGRAISSASEREQPGFINSTYELYVARQGQPFQIAHRQEGLVIPRGQHWDASVGINPDNEGDPGYANSGGWTLHDGHPLAEYGKIWLLPYHTAKDPAEAHQNASIWYDELIISTQNIAAPGAGSSGGGPPAAYTLRFDPDDHANGTPLNGATVGGSAYVYVSPDTDVSRVDFFLNGQARNSEFIPPYDLQGSDTLFNFDQLDDGRNTITAKVTTTASQTVTLNATFQVGTGAGTNQSPATPAVAVPAGLISLDEAGLSSGAYADPDGDTLAASEWEIARDASFAERVLQKRIAGRTAIVLTVGVLDPSSDYWIRTRHEDSRGALSGWSAPVIVTTATTFPGDVNGNGIEDDSEVFGFADTNGNGTSDAAEGICNLMVGQGGNMAGLESGVGNVRCYRSLDANDAPQPPSAEMRFPFGLFSFRIDGLPVDPVAPARVTMRVHLPSRPSGSVRWYKLDPAAGNLFELAASVPFEGNTAILELVDGGIGDFDGVVNGVIVDPSGPLTIPSSGGTGGSGGNQSQGGGGSGVLLAALMAVVAIARRRCATPH
jgi:hypothetical protein